MVFLQCALNGRRAPGEHDALPVTPEQLAREARAAVDAGAAALHLHPRGEDGGDSLAPADRDAAVAALRDAVPDVELSLTTGLWITGGDVAQRLEQVRGWSELPDCCSLNVADPRRARGHAVAARRAPRRLQRRARRRRRRALRRQDIRLTASSAATL